MSIVIDIKDSLRKAIYNKDNTINFNFNEIQVVQYPYVFFYIPSFKIDKAIDNNYWRKLDLMCVIEYMKSEDNNQNELWAYTDTLADALKLFDLYDTKISANNLEFKTVENVLQCTFDLTVYVKAKDDQTIDELMQELILELKQI